MMSFGPLNEETNPYVRTLVEGLAEELHISTLDWRALLQAKVDVLHVHWPESLVRHPTRLGRFLKAALLSVILLSPLRPAIVLTQHNLRPHEPGTLSERIALRLLARKVDHTISINALNVCKDGVRHSTILHGPYASQLPAVPVSQRRGALFFGLLRPYKGIEGLIEAYQCVPENDPLTIIGMATEDYARALEAQAAQNSLIRVRVERPDDDELERLIRSVRTVILPNPSMFNSGAAIQSLSYGTRVLLADTPSNRLLQSEFSAEYVRLFQQSLKTSDIKLAVEAPMKLAPPDMGTRAWADAFDAHKKAYRYAYANRHGAQVLAEDGSA